MHTYCFDITETHALRTPEKFKTAQFTYLALMQLCLTTDLLLSIHLPNPNKLKLKVTFRYVSTHRVSLLCKVWVFPYFIWCNTYIYEYKKKCRTSNINIPVLLFLLHSLSYCTTRVKNHLLRKEIWIAFDTNEITKRLFNTFAKFLIEQGHSKIFTWFRIFGTKEILLLFYVQPCSSLLFILHSSDRPRKKSQTQKVLTQTTHITKTDN